MRLSIATGKSAIVAGTQTFDDGFFGYNYTGFRSFDRLEAQLADSKIGLITWPGGSLAENAPDKFGLEYDGLWNGGATQADLPELIEAVNGHGAGLSVVLPTLRYMGRLDAMRADIRSFMTDLLGGAYGPMPERMILEIGSEYYATFINVPNGPAEYARVANAMIEEIQSALDDPTINRLSADIEIAMQAGRGMADDAVIRAGMSDTTLRSIDMLIHHRFSFTAEGVDPSATEMGRILDAWEVRAEAAGGDRPDLFLGTYNVASYTRGEALRDYIAMMKGQGVDISARDIDVENRTHTGFETFWQKRLERYDYGAEHPRVLLEMMAEYAAEGMGGAGTYGSDMLHPGRFTYTDAKGQPVKFVGQDMLDMMAESITGTKLLKVSLTNDARDSVWAYGFESNDKLVLFLSAGDVPPGQVQLKLPDMSKYRAVWGDSLTSEVPPDWMERFGIPDNPRIDETPEAQSYALGLREGIVPRIGRGGVSISLNDPNEVIRLAFAKTPAGAEEIAGWSDGARVEIGPSVGRTPALMLAGDVEEDADLLELFTREPVAEDRPVDGGDDQDDTDDPDGFAATLADMGLGGLMVALPALLLMFAA